MTGFLAVAVGAAGGAAAVVEDEDAPLGSEGEADEADEVEGPARCDSLRSEKDVWW